MMSGFDCTTCGRHHDGVEEYELMRLLAELDGDSARADSVVNSIIGQPFGKQSIGRLDVWSYDPQAWDSARETLGAMIEARIRGKK